MYVMILKEELFDKLDEGTKNHSLRVANLSKKIAESLNISSSNRIYEIAKFHDIGKLKIDPKVLFKPDRLTIEEFEIIKQHPKLGIELIQDYFGTDDLKSILYHHENVDGSGYYGITKIPIAAKIIRVADVYDALTSTRCYKDAYNKEDALFMMSHNIGTQFDQKIFEKFLKIIMNQ